MISPLVSIIIPVYNVEPWLSACLNSLLAQNLHEWEAILVNDGSTDESGRILNTYSAKDNRFKVIHQTNKGLGGARNAGVAAATGQFLFFLDSDDIILPNTLADMTSQAKALKADMVISDFITFPDGTTPDVNATYPLPANSPYARLATQFPTGFTWRNLQGDFETLYTHMIFCIACVKLFRTERWKALGCESPQDLRMAEDFIPVKKMLFSGSKIAVAPRCAILYRKRQGSATTRRSNKAWEALRAIPLALDMFQSAGVLEEEKQNIYRFMLYLLNLHMFYMLPFQNWPSYFQKAGNIVRSWPANLHFPQPDEAMLNLYRKGGLTDLLYLILRYRLVYCLPASLRITLKHKLLSHLKMARL